MCMFYQMEQRSDNVKVERMRTAAGHQSGKALETRGAEIEIELASLRPGSPAPEGISTVSDHYLHRLFQEVA